MIFFLAMLLAVIAGCGSKPAVLKPIPDPMFTEVSQMSIEGFFAYEANAIIDKLIPDDKPEPSKPVNPTTVCEKCKGTGFITSGDGLFKFKCPDCGGNKGSEPPVIAKEKVVQIVYFGHAEECAPCAQVVKYVFPPMRSEGWKVGPEKDAHIRLVDSYSQEEANAQLSAIPTFIRYEDGVEVDRWVGYASHSILSHMYYNDVFYKNKKKELQK